MVLSAVLFSACAVTVQDYAQNQPTLQMTEFFQGSLTAHGVVKNFRGRVIRHFNADITAYWRDGTGYLEEDFVFDNGDLERRVWTLEPSDTGGYTGTAGDVIGTGDVTVSGNSAFLDYVLRIPFNDGTIDIRVDDHADPLAELRRLYGVARERSIPFSASLPNRARPYGILDRAIIDRIIERDAGKPLAASVEIPET